MPQLIEAGDVDLLRALRRCGHLPGGLQGADDLGLTPAYLAVHFDRPAVLDFLREDGVDLTVACDGVGADGHGTPAFYAAFHGKVRVLRALARLGVAMEAPCTRFGEAPAEFFDRHGPAVAEQLRAAANFRHATATRLARFLWMGPARRRLALARRYARLLQNAYRGHSVRRHAADLAMALVADCVEINQCVGCTRQFFTKSFLGDDAAVLARSSDEERAPPRYRAGVASIAWRTTR